MYDFKDAQMHGQQNAANGNAPMSGGISGQPGFISRGVFMPICDAFIIGQAKTIMCVN